MGGENLAEIQFENCELPVENVILRKDGFRKLSHAFNTQRCLNPSVSLGLAEGAFEEAIKYARDRTAFGRAIGEFQGMRWKIAEMYRDIEAGRSLLYRACLTANPFPDPYEAAIAKMYCNEMALRVTSEAIQVHGGYGFTDEYPVSRFYRGARYGTLGGGTTETLKDLVGKKLIGDFDGRRFPGNGNVLMSATSTSRRLRARLIMRSLLFVPGHDARKLAKGRDCGADALIVDLEDSVPDAEKPRARGVRRRVRRRESRPVAALSCGSTR